MSIFSRLNALVSANVNSAIDTLEKPEIMIDQYIRDAEKSLGDVKGKAAETKVVLEKAKAKAEKNLKRTEELNALAEKAMLAGNEEDAKRFLEESVVLEKQQEMLDKAVEDADDNFRRIYDIHGKLRNDFSKMVLERDALKSRATVARASEEARKALARYESKDVTSDFNRMREKIDDMVAKQQAMDELDEDPLAKIENKYKDMELSSEAQAKFDALKEKIAG